MTPEREPGVSSPLDAAPQSQRRRVPPPPGAVEIVGMPTKTDLRDQIAERLAAWQTKHATICEHTQILSYAEAADEIMAVVEGEALDRMADKLLQDTNLRAMDFRNGMSMDIEPAQALAANWVAAARTILGDADNYSETTVTMDIGLAGQPERFALVVQRVGKLTPHQARKLAEDRAEQAEKALAAANLTLKIARLISNALLARDLNRARRRLHKRMYVPAPLVVGLVDAIRALDSEETR